ncbi:hypothetical protein N9J30_07890 [Gammaproteobacteria bacterium]|nr:hypothetical protein [Gammaproteobacteria bacterium]
MNGYGFAFLMFMVVLLSLPEGAQVFILGIVIPVVIGLGILSVQSQAHNGEAAYKKSKEEQDKAQKNTKPKYQSDYEHSKTTEISSENRTVRSVEVQSKVANVTPEIPINQALGKISGARYCDGCGRLNSMIPRKLMLADEYFCSSCRAYLNQE